MATYKSPAEKGLERKLKAWSEKDLGMQIGACVNKAVDISIAEKKLTKANLVKWVDALFEIGVEKKKEELWKQYKATPDPLEVQQEYNDQMEKDRNEAMVDDMNKQAAEAAELEKNNTTPF